jgi:hypothetical protein
MRTLRIEADFVAGAAVLELRLPRWNEEIEERSFVAALLWMTA